MARKKARRKKKSYNAFKMWGSYVGLLIAGIVNLLLGTSNIFIVGFRALFFLEGGGFEVIVFYAILIIGFLIGWGIHSLIRKIRK